MNDRPYLPRPDRPFLITILVIIALAAGLALPVVAQSDPDTAPEASPSIDASDATVTRASPRADWVGGAGLETTEARPLRLRLGVGRVDLTVVHGPVEAILVDAGSDGHQLGDVRVASTPIEVVGGDTVGRLDATLTTTALDMPAPGDEIRIGTLVFSFGDGASQIVVEGSAHYPADGATIAAGTATVRSITGGSGRFDGVSGSATTRHLEDDSWVHHFHFGRAGRDAGLALRRVLRQRLRDGAREFRAGLRERAAEHRQEERAERREDRRLDRAARRTDRADRRLDRAARRVERVAGGGEESEIRRDDLGIVEPGSAVGEELGLWRYTIPAGSELTPHTHPGWQLARIDRGELEYTVIAGEGEVIRQDGTRESIGPGTYTLRAGDTVVENPDVEHFGANRTRRPVSILAATLYPAGAPLSAPLEQTEPEASNAMTGASEAMTETEAAASPAP